MTPQWQPVSAEFLRDSYDAEIFGRSLSLSSDGTILTVGAFMNSVNDPNGGRVVQYDLTDPGEFDEVYGKEGDFVGYNVGASSDGTRLAVHFSLDGRYDIYDYSATENGVQFVTSFIPPDIFPGSSDFALSGDGKWITMIGEAFYQETGETDLFLYLYKFDEDNRLFNQHGERILISTYTALQWGEFNVAIDSNGRYVAVSQIGQGEFRGEVRAYRRFGPGLTELGIPFVSENMEEDFGRAIEVVSSSTGTLILGYSVSFEDTVYVYTFQANTWEPLGLPISGIDVLGVPSEFGYDIAFDSSASRLLVGGPGYFGFSGIVMAFELDQGDWWPLGNPQYGPPGSQFGEAVAFNADGTWFAAGAPMDCISESVCGGSVYLYNDIES